MNPRFYRPDIDGLRAVAIIGVVVFHAWPNALPGGFVGVDVFFVISGFLITGIITRGLEAEKFSFAVFYANRVKRIFPSLVVVLLACLAYGWFELMPRDYVQLGKHVDASSAFVENFVLWTESGYFDAAALHKPLLHMWSLAIEEQFYLFYPTTVYLLWRLGRRAAIFGIAGLAMVSFVANMVVVGKHPTMAFYLPLTRVWELFAGGILALGGGALPRYRNLASLVGLGLIALSMFVFDGTTMFPGWAALVPVIGTLLVMHAGRDAFVNRTLLATRVVVGIGLISYPLYLWHWPLLSFADTSDVATWSQLRAAIVVISFALAWLTYRFVEHPFRFGPRSNRLKVCVLAGTAVVVAALAAVVQVERGFDSRLPPEIRAIATWEYDFKTDARYPACWVADEATFEQFAPACWGGLRGPHGRGTIVVWGDSHAARLYPGLARSFPAADLAELTRNSCAPILSPTTTPNCRASNEKILDTLVQYRPKRVLLVSAWQEHGVQWDVTTAIGRGLSTVLDRLHEAGIEEVLVIGPAPQWRDTLTTLIAKAYSTRHEVPRRLSMDLVVPEVRVVDGALARLVRGRPGVRYVSVLDTVCTNEGCLAFASDSPTSYFSWDLAHLTTEGAAFVASRLGL